MQNEKNKNRDLLSELEQETEFKEPTAGTAKTWTWEEDNNAITDAREVDDDDQEDENETTSPDAAAKKKKLTEDEIKAAAVASAAGVELLTSLLSEGIISLRYRFKTTDEDRDALEERLLDSDFNTLTPEEQFKVRRDKRLKAECEAKIARITKSDKVRKRMEDAFADYSRATGKVFLTPTTRLWVHISEDVIKSVLASFVY